MSTVNGLRLGTVLFWLGAVVLFFAPWCQISCRSPDGHEEDHYSYSGAQIAWGGVTATPDGEQTTYVLAHYKAFQSGFGFVRVLLCLILTSYLEGILLGIGFALWDIRRRNSTPRGRSAWALLLFAAFVLGCWMSFGDPFKPPEEAFDAPGVTLRERWRVESHFTIWYYLMYVANAGALVCSIAEFHAIERLSASNSNMRATTQA
jgi:hypothetical protein